MTYRLIEGRVRVGDDSTLGEGSADLPFSWSKAVDLKESVIKARVAPADNEAALSLNVTTGYFVAVLSDYPVKVRFNGAGETQFTLTSSNVAAVSYGAPLPYNCGMVATWQVTSIRLAPIAAAAQTANVRIVVTGDPVNAYT